MQDGVRVLAGTIVVVTTALGYIYSPYWYLVTAFVNVNLVQSAFTGWCPAELLFRKMGLKDAPVV